MDMLMWKKFFEVVAFVVVFAVPVILYLMEKAGSSLTGIFVLGWTSIAAAALYLVLNIPWVWADAILAVRVWRVCFVCATALLAVGYGAIKIWPSMPIVLSPPSTPTPLPPQPTSAFDSKLSKWRLENEPDSLELHDLFLLDSGSVTQNQFGAIFVDDPHTVRVQYGINIDLPARSKFLSFYVGRQDKETEAICKYLAEKHQWILDNAPQLLVEQKNPGDSGTVSTKEAVFSGRIYVYHETYLSAEITVKLAEFYKNMGLSGIFRSTDYLSTKKMEANLRKLRKPPSHTATQQAPLKPDIYAEFIKGNSPGLVLRNSSTAILQGPMYSITAWNLTTRISLPSYVKNEKDMFIKQDGGILEATLDNPPMKPQIKTGDRILALLTLDCPECIRSKYYWLVVVYGGESWFSRLPANESVNPAHMGKLLGDVDWDLERFMEQAPHGQRLPPKDF